MRMLKNGVQGEVLRTKTEKVTEHWRKLHNYELHDFIPH